MDEQQRGGNPDAPRNPGYDLLDFLAENSRDTDPPVITLYRVSRERGEPEKFEFLETFHVVPDLADIRDTYGPGKYRLCCKYTRVNGGRGDTTRTVHIAAPQRQDAPATMGAVAPAQQITVRDVLEMQRASFESIALIMRELVKQPRGGDNNRGGALDLAQLGAAFGRILEEQQMRSIRMVDHVMSSKMGIPAPADDNDENEEGGAPEGLWQWITWLWDTFGKRIIKDRSIAAGVAPLVQQQPQVAYLLQHPAEYAAMIGRLEHEHGVPGEHIRSTLAALQLPTPDELSADDDSEGADAGENEGQ